eukprot:g3255.t1
MTSSKNHHQTNHPYRHESNIQPLLTQASKQIEGTLSDYIDEIESIKGLVEVGRIEREKLNTRFESVSDQLVEGLENLGTSVGDLQQQIIQSDQNSKVSNEQVQRERDEILNRIESELETRIERKMQNTKNFCRCTKNELMQTIEMKNKERSAVLERILQSITRQSDDKYKDTMNRLSQLEEFPSTLKSRFDDVYVAMQEHKSRHDQRHTEHDNKFQRIISEFDSHKKYSRNVDNKIKDVSEEFQKALMKQEDIYKRKLQQHLDDTLDHMHKQHDQHVYHTRELIEKHSTTEKISNLHNDHNDLKDEFALHRQSVDQRLDDHTKKLYSHLDESLLREREGYMNHTREFGRLVSAEREQRERLHGTLEQRLLEIDRKHHNHIDEVSRNHQSAIDSVKVECKKEFQQHLHKLKKNHNVLTERINEMANSNDQSKREYANRVAGIKKIHKDLIDKFEDRLNHHKNTNEALHERHIESNEKTMDYIANVKKEMIRDADKLSRYHESKYMEHHRNVSEIQQMVQNHHNLLSEHIDKFNRKMKGDEFNRSEFERKLTQQQNQLCLEQLDRIDSIMASEKRLCTQMLLNQARDQMAYFMESELNQLRRELNLPLKKYNEFNVKRGLPLHAYEASSQNYYTENVVSEAPGTVLLIEKCRTSLIRQVEDIRQHVISLEKKTDLLLENCVQEAMKRMNFDSGNSPNVTKEMLESRIKELSNSHNQHIENRLSDHERQQKMTQEASELQVKELRELLERERNDHNRAMDEMRLALREAGNAVKSAISSSTEKHMRTMREANHTNQELMRQLEYYKSTS